jgi:hypothetical protein
MKLGMYIIAPKPDSAAYFINPFHQPVCLYVCLSCRCYERLGKMYSSFHC